MEFLQVHSSRVGLGGQTISIMALTSIRVRCYYTKKPCDAESVMFEPILSRLDYYKGGKMHSRIGMTRRILIEIRFRNCCYAAIMHILVLKSFKEFLKNLSGIPDSHRGMLLIS